MGTGGSRYGAGRPWWKRKAEQSQVFDVRQVAAKGILRPGAFSWHWSNNYGDRVGSVNVRIADNAERLILSYRWTPCGSDPRHHRPERRRTWRALCLPSLCPCCNLEQSEDEMGRLWRRQCKIERKLSGGAGEWNGWQKPKGMHQQTFDWLRSQIWELETRRDEVFEIMAAPLLRRLGLNR